tara:strand:+ start:816 stop:1070 length:255 start_codon:yes stop_codon:yes gene_type:complete
MIQFNNKINVILIPDRKEIEKSGLLKSLWWNKIELEECRKNFSNDLRVISAINNINFDNTKNISKVKNIWSNNLFNDLKRIKNK